MTKPSSFIAYPAYPPIIGTAIEGALEKLKTRRLFTNVESWKQHDTPGCFIRENVLFGIDAADFLIADITVPNFNVTYEIGYAIGKKKKLILTCHEGIEQQGKTIQEVGIYDTLLYRKYQNSEDFVTLVNSLKDKSFLAISNKANLRAPIYLLNPLIKDDAIIEVQSRIKKAGFFYRGFDPNESQRMSASVEIDNIGESFGVVVPLITSDFADHSIHNLRAAFIAGLAHGMEKRTLIIQFGDDPVPLDYRDLVSYGKSPKQIKDAIADFVPTVAEAIQGTNAPLLSDGSLLQTISLGASAAENEQDLSSYYLETDKFRSVFNGEARIVLGRKGSGKSALFKQIKDKRTSRNNLVIDLQPETYKLKKFKNDVLSLLDEGSLEHTIMAFWEYVILTEMCARIIKNDSQLHLRDHKLTEGYNRLKSLYYDGEYISDSDFPERMAKLLTAISNDFKAKYDAENQLRLSRAAVTELIYRHQIHDLKNNLILYLKEKDEVIILIDNLDKGWNTQGVDQNDLIVLRTLLEASRKVSNDLKTKSIKCTSTIFLRSDIYDFLLEATADRGKESKVTLDWTDEDSLRELIRKRLVHNGMEKSAEFNKLWHSLCVSHVGGEESFQYIVDRSLMRPRILIDIIHCCRGFAINRGHSKIEDQDIIEGIKVNSHTLLEEINFEIRDVFPSAGEILYSFVGAQSTVDEDDIKLHLLDMSFHFTSDEFSRLIKLLLWYGILGFVRKNGERVFINNELYNMKIMLAKIAKEYTGSTLPMYCFNAALWPALEIKN